ncbi:hypothetical protein JYQ62_23495 [Nostoc sp. UHCC 0702]|nr:hypothetical protein JYQ62_23495 [Nostoc sp. UHCC 0702]
MNDIPRELQFHIIHRESGKYLEATGKTVSVRPRNRENPDQQTWIFMEVDGGHYLLHIASREALDAGALGENIYTNPLNPDLSDPNQYQIWERSGNLECCSFVHKTDGKFLDADGDKVTIQSHKSGNKNQDWIIQPA